MSNFVVSARKYRPRRFSEVVGQDHIVTTLQSALAVDQLPHAMLFCGPRGIGKTTCARILARTINCTSPTANGDPCGTCAACKSFEQNASFNIFELDAASYNGVDSIRQLNEQVRVPPSQGSFKVYIIDEVHMLSTQAFNAFLKTLEEPPPYAIFILATTEKHKILPTILSRCQIFDFRRIQVKDIASHLGEIAQKEEISADHDALITIAEKSDGALRDALSLFDRLANVSNRKITYKSVVENLNLLDYDIFFNVVDACLREDITDVLVMFDRVIRDGFEGDIFLDGLAAHYRDLLVCRNPATLALQDHSESLKERYQNQASLMSAPYIFSALNLINEADVQYPLVRNKRLHVEITLAKVCFLKRVTTGSPFVPEKKTIEPTDKVKRASAEKEHESAISISSKAEIPQIPEISSVPPETLEAEPTAPPEKSSVSAAGPEVTVQLPNLKKAKKLVKVDSTGNSPFRRPKSVIPQVKSLTDIESEIQTTERLARENSLELTQDNLLNWWQEYQGQVSSPSVATALKMTQISFKEKHIVIEVPSLVTKTRIQEMNSLLTDLRTAFHDNDLQLDVEINAPFEEDETSKPKKLLTNKEKYEILTAKNPNIEDLRQSLDLIVDHDD